LCYFLGCTFEEMANLVGGSATQAKRSYELAKLWLRRKLKEYDMDS
jgi:hypothetical protein